MMLQVENIVTLYGLSMVIQGLSLRVEAGEVVALLGRNGAGKTTTLRSIMGLTPPRSGHIRFDGVDIVGKPPHQIARLGIGYVPDDRRIFPDLTVEENLELARRAIPFRMADFGWRTIPFRMVDWIDHRIRNPPSETCTEPSRSVRNGVGRGPWTVAKVYELFPVLGEYRHRGGTQLSGGEQKMLALGRALVQNPRLLLLDEAVEGLAPLIVQEFVHVIREISASGITILMADQNLKFARQVAQRGYIIDKGRIEYHDEIERIWANEDIVRRYLAV